MAELQYRMLGEDEKTWTKKLFFRELGRGGNPDSAFILLLASDRRHGEDAKPETLTPEVFSKLVGSYAQGHLTNSPREMVRGLMEIVSAEAGMARESGVDLAAGFIHIKGLHGAAGSIGRLRAGFGNQERLVASSPLLTRGKGKSAGEQVSLDLGQTVEADLEELSAFFLAPSSATAMGEEPMRRFLWDFVSDEGGLGWKAPAGWEHLPCLVGRVGEFAEKAPSIELKRPADVVYGAHEGGGPPSRRALHWIGGIAGAAVLAVAVGLLMTRGGGVPRGSSIEAPLGAEQHAAPAEESHAAPENAGLAEGTPQSSAGAIQADEADGSGHASAVLSLLWRKSLGEVITSSPVGVGETLAFGSRSGAVHCVSMRDGSDRWVFKGADGFGSSPTEWGGRLFIGCYDGSIYCINAGDGSQRWRYRTGGKVVSSPLVTEGGRVLVGSFDGVFYCLSVDGELLWRFEAGSRLWSSPAAEGSAVLIGDMGGTVHCLDLNSGKARWSKAVGGEIYGSPAVGEGVVFFGSSNGKVVALSAADGRERWKYQRQGGVSSSESLVPGALLAGYEDKVLVALDPADGRALWEAALPGPVRSKPVLLNGAVVVTCYDGSVLLIDTTSGSILADFTAGARVYATPAVANGVVYFGDMKGDFLALSATGLSSD